MALPQRSLLAAYSMPVATPVTIAAFNPKLLQKLAKNLSIPLHQPAMYCCQALP
jgi:hypothetical protein